MYADVDNWTQVHGRNTRGRDSLLSFLPPSLPPSLPLFLSPLSLSLPPSLSLARTHNLALAFAYSASAHVAAPRLRVVTLAPPVVTKSVCVCVCLCALARACVRVCVRARVCVRVCVRACVRTGGRAGVRARIHTYTQHARTRLNAWRHAKQQTDLHALLVCALARVPARVYMFMHIFTLHKATPHTTHTCARAHTHTHTQTHKHTHDSTSSSSHAFCKLRSRPANIMSSPAPPLLPRMRPSMHSCNKMPALSRLTVCASSESCEWMRCRLGCAGTVMSPRFCLSAIN